MSERRPAVDCRGCDCAETWPRIRIVQCRRGAVPAAGGGRALLRRLFGRSSVMAVYVHQYHDGRWRWAADTHEAGRNPVAIGTTSWRHRENAIQEAREVFPAAAVFFS